MTAPDRARAWRLAAFVVVALALAIWVAGVEHLPAGPAADPAPTEPGGAAQRLEQLPVAPELDPAGYQRELFGDWATGPDGCTTRERVLIDESQVPATVTHGCQVTAGQWLSAYDAATVTDPGGLDIDHVVALAEAWTSGAATWPAEQRAAFANDLTHPASLIAVTAATNRSKSDQDPAEWLPPDPAATCPYVAAWIDTKATWGLSVDPAEHDALARILATCTTAPTGDSR